MKYYLSGDIGGTKTLLQICAEHEHVPLFQKYYTNAAYVSLENILDEFLLEAQVKNIFSACFALAGPVSGRVVSLTNLPWRVDSDALATRYNIRHVALTNDFEAVGHGIAALKAEDLDTMQVGAAFPHGVRLVVGAGTGLGVAWLTAAGAHYQVLPSEGGHMDFAPADELQYLLLRHLQLKHDHVSYERIVSGPGLIAIYEFMRDSGFASPSEKLLAALKQSQDFAACISQFSQQAEEILARMTVDLFLAIYGAFVGNMALASLPRGGIYVAGGMAAKMAAQLRHDDFSKGYLSKGRFGRMLAEFPLHIVLNEKVGLMGANLLAQRHA